MLLLAPLRESALSVRPSNNPNPLDMETLTYEDCKELKDAGFPQKTLNKSISCPEYGNDRWKIEPNYCGHFLHEPSLSGLIEACGEEFLGLAHATDVGDGKRWSAFNIDFPIGVLEGISPEQAVKNLWIILNKK